MPVLKRIYTIFLIALFFSLLVTPAQVRASSNPGDVKALDEGRRQYWRMGYVLTSSPSYSHLAGRAASLATRMQSNIDTDIYFVFPAVSGKPYVHTASYLILNRRGAYNGNATLSLGIYNFDGTLRKQISTNSIDLQTAPTQTWTNLALDSYYINCQIGSGEFLAFHLALDGAAGGNLNVNPIFEVAVEPVLQSYLQFFFPLVVKQCHHCQ
jgi:hypothetical protein